jgi:uncharacterized protein (TIGR00299 family) protein
MLAYFDCFSGISGDMTLGALLDLGVPLQWLQDTLTGIPLAGFDIRISSAYRSGIRGNQVAVLVDDDPHEQNFADIKTIISNSPLSDTVKSTSSAIFKRLAEAEGIIHGCPPEEVHFHEVGGIDAMVDIIGTALCLEYLGISQVAASKIPLGKGFANCRHGKLPVPSPATVAILNDVPVYGTEIEHELVTPTGAAIISTLAQTFGSLPEMRIQNIGYGAGERQLESRPNLLRIITGEPVAQNSDADANLQMDRVWIIEASIDDMNPEVFGFVMERLFEDGALDVYWIPVYMKKNRPGTLVQVLCHTPKRDAIVRRMLSETTSLGVRYYEARRRLLVRDQFTIKSSFGSITVKRIKDPWGNERLVPEYEICKKIALENDLPLRVVYDTIAKDADSGDRLKG